eukprot:symbB.v1.2.023647.t1/scaffold2175.1/size86943/2
MDAEKRRVERTIHVSGCSNDTLSNIIQGVYTTKGSNHGKPVYKKEGPRSSATVLIYYWDLVAFSKLGGDLAWACNAGKVHGNPAMPPASNWQVLCDEKVDDRLRIGPVGREGPERREEERRREKRQRQDTSGSAPSVF